MSRPGRVSHTRGDMTVNDRRPQEGYRHEDISRRIRASKGARDPRRRAFGGGTAGDPARGVRFAPCQRRSRPLTSIARMGRRPVGLVHRRPDAPRAPVVHERRLELGLDAAVLDLGDERRRGRRPRARGASQHSAHASTSVVEQRQAGRVGRHVTCANLSSAFEANSRQSSLRPSPTKLTTKPRLARSAASVRDPRSTQTRIVGGSAETLHTAVVVRPRGAPSSSRRW